MSMAGAVEFSNELELEARVGELMGVINASTAALVAVIAKVAAEETWREFWGIRSLEHWIAWQCGVSSSRAHRLATMARRRNELPSCVALFDEATITEDAMATIAAGVPAERDEEIAELAPVVLHSQLTRLVASLPKPEPEPKPEPDPEVRAVSFGVDGHRWRATLDLPKDEGALIELSWSAARDQLFHERHPDHDPTAPTCDRTITWADGVLHSAELALRGLESDWTRPVGERNQLVLHYDLDRQHAELHQSGTIPAALRRYLSCDATCRAVATVDGVPVAYTERQHTVSRRLRRLIEHRDRGCRVPGCEQRRWLHIHHLRHWEDEGRTEPANLCALCPYHHRLHHVGHLVISGDPTTPNGLAFTDRHGRPLGARPPDPPSATPPEFLVTYQHPSGEPLDTHWITWHNLN